MEEEYKRVKELHPNHLLIIRKDNYGEIYGEDANVFSELFSISKDENGVICFLWDLLDNVLRALIRNGIKVAVLS